MSSPPWRFPPTHLPDPSLPPRCPHPQSPKPCPPATGLSWTSVPATRGPKPGHSPWSPCSCLLATSPLSAGCSGPAALSVVCPLSSNIAWGRARNVQSRACPGLANGNRSPYPVAPQVVLMVKLRPTTVGYPPLPHPTPTAPRCLDVTSQIPASLPGSPSPFPRSLPRSSFTGPLETNGHWIP